MSTDRREHPRVEAVRDPVLFTGFTQLVGQPRVDRVRQAWCEVVLDLVIETPAEPTEQGTDDRQRCGDIDRGAQLVSSELIAPSLDFRPGDVGVVHTVGELEHHRQGEADAP